MKDSSGTSTTRMWAVTKSYGYSKLEDITKRSSEISILKEYFLKKMLDPFYVYVNNQGDSENLASVEYKVNSEQQYSYFHSIIYGMEMELPSKNNLSVIIDHNRSCGVYNLIITHGEHLIFLQLQDNSLRSFSTFEYSKLHPNELAAYKLGHAR